MVDAGRLIHPNEAFAQRTETLYEQIATILATETGLREEAKHHIATLVEEIRLQVKEIQQSQSTLEKERFYYKQLFSAAPIAYLVTDQHGLILDANQTAHDLLNVRDQQLISKPLIMFVPAEYQSSFRQLLLDSNTIRTWEGYLQPRQSSTHRLIEFTLAPLAASQSPNSDFQLRWLLRDLTTYHQEEASKLEHFFRETFEQAAIGIAHVDVDDHWFRVNQTVCNLFGYSQEELGALTLYDLTLPNDVLMLTSIHEQLKTGGVHHIQLENRFVGSLGNVIWAQLTLSAVYNISGQYIYSVAVINNITESKAVMVAEQKQRALADALRESSINLTSTLDLETVLNRMIAIMSRIFSYDAACVFLIDENGPCMVRMWGYDAAVIPAQEGNIQHLPSLTDENGVFEKVAASRQSYILHNLAEHPNSHIRSLICVPIISQDEVIGYLELYSALPNFFTHAHDTQLQTFAAHAGIAIRNARTHQQAQMLAAHDERQRLARDLHDSVTQNLFSASLISEALITQGTHNESKFIHRLEDLHILTRGALAEMRNLLMELRPDFLLKTSLGAQLRQLSEALKSRKKIKINLSISNDSAMPDDVHIAFYRIAQEILNNVVKHSAATQVNIHLDARSDQVDLRIEDNGVGFILANAEGMGILNMQERANTINAALEVISKVGNGTQITLTWMGST